MYTHVSVHAYSTYLKSDSFLYICMHIIIHRYIWIAHKSHSLSYTHSHTHRYTPIYNCYYIDKSSLAFKKDTNIIILTVPS